MQCLFGCSKQLKGLFLSKFLFLTSYSQESGSLEELLVLIQLVILFFNLADGYPFEPPKMQFVTKVWYGDVCMQCLYFELWFSVFLFSLV